MSGGQDNVELNNTSMTEEEFTKQKKNKKIEILTEAVKNNDVTHTNNKKMLKKVAEYFNITIIKELEGGGDVNNTHGLSNGTHDILGGSSKKTKRRRKKHRKSNKR
jgi:hypothetical protein